MKNLQEKYIAGLDGLRAVAVLMVIGYHLKLPIFKGGVLGVTIFFVISGFLITRLLLQELQKTNKIDLKNFWIKRIKRIWPALILMVSVTVIVCALFNRLLLSKASQDYISVLLGYNNWYQIFNNISYFDNGVAPSPLLHCWSLAIETQFYLIFPLIIIIIAKLKSTKKERYQVLSIITTVLIIVSSLLMMILFNPNGDPSRVYYGLDTRCFSLLVGALLAIIVESDIKIGLTKPANDIIGIISLICVCIIVTKVAGYDAFLYKGGYLLTSILTAFVILSILRKQSMLSKFLSIPVIDWLGKLSYSIYLWHYPIIILISGGKTSSWYIMLIEVILTLVLASASYYLVETPIRRGILSKTVKMLKDKIQKDQRVIKKGITIASVCLALIVTSTLCVAFVPKENMSDDIVQESSNKVVKKDIKKPETTPSTTNSQDSQYVDLSNGQEIINNLDVFVIGDLIVSGSFAKFQETFPHLKLSSKESRQANLSIPILTSALNEEGWNGDSLIFALGTNGPLYDYLPKVRELLPQDKTMFVISLHAPYTQWQDDNNQKIEEFCKNTDNVYLIDWAQYCKGHNDWFEKDQTHPNKLGGTEQFLNCIKESIIKAYQKDKIKLTKKS